MNKNGERASGVISNIKYHLLYKKVSNNFILSLKRGGLSAAFKFQFEF